MSSPTRRQFLRRTTTTLGSAALLNAFPPAIRKALAVPADKRSGTIEDVEHIVLLMMENRAFDHYFGSMNGVRGFADRFPVPVSDTAELKRKTVWYQRNDAAGAGAPRILAPQHLDTLADFAVLRNTSTPHLYPDAQDAWDHGRMARWPRFKTDASMVYFTEADLPFQFALANAFTLCDANHCSMTGGTNPNRCYFFTGTNHGNAAPGPGIYNGPAVDNEYNTLTNGAVRGGYTWTSYAERLEDAGVSWQIYQNEEHDFYAMNPLLGFKAFRDANAASTPFASPARTAGQQALYDKGIRTRDLDLLKADVVAGRLPKVSWICPTASASEHPSASSPAQGADYVARVLDALTANPEVWSRTALIVNFDENDGLFDHVPPPAPPSYVRWDADPAQAVLAGASTVDASDEYLGDDDGGIASVDAYRHRPWGLGPRVPMYVISPWSKGGWVNSQVFDQTSTIRFVEARFGVREPNIGPWRRAVTGDLTTCFDFATPNDADAIRSLPETARRDAASRALRKTTRPIAPPLPSLPTQARGTRPSRPLPYELEAVCELGGEGAGPAALQLRFENHGSAGAVFHVYDRLALDRIPLRFTVEAGKRSSASVPVRADGSYDLWLLGPNGFHRQFTGAVGPERRGPEVQVAYDKGTCALRITLRNNGSAPCVFSLAPNAYFDTAATRHELALAAELVVIRPLAASQGWYDFSATLGSQPAYSRRFAGRLETGRPSVSDPAMHGTAIGEQYRRA
ncbi:MAG: phospholipase C, phosphocholine-specific [Pseudomonadota bacterium]|nr:phospholipase C, phosphocholine-specific [Pseudomonadota bacterium]